jgi:hypothetical protein
MASVPSRRTACVRCVRGKRRCDAQKPKCSRCTRVGLSCIYARPAGDQSNPDSVAGAVIVHNWPASISTAEGGGSVSNRATARFTTPRTITQTVYLPRSLVTYCSRRLSECAFEIVRTGRTLFVRSERSPDELTGALGVASSAIATYHSRDATLDVRSTVIEKYRHLLSAAPHSDFQSELEHTQALLLLHIVQLFGADQALVAEARQGIDKLRLRILRLQRQAELSPTEKDVDRSYSDWIRAESVRRTILVSTFAESIFLAATEGVCTTVGFVSQSACASVAYH